MSWEYVLNSENEILYSFKYWLNKSANSSLSFVTGKVKILLIKHREGFLTGIIFSEHVKIFDITNHPPLLVKLEET